MKTSTLVLTLFLAVNPAGSVNVNYEDIYGTANATRNICNLGFNGFARRTDIAIIPVSWQSGGSLSGFVVSKQSRTRAVSIIASIAGTDQLISFDLNGWSRIILDGDVDKYEGWCRVLDSGKYDLQRLGSPFYFPFVKLRMVMSDFIKCPGKRGHDVGAKKLRGGAYFVTAFLNRALSDLAHQETSVIVLDYASTREEYSTLTANLAA